jgi:hypothetical protein
MTYRDLLQEIANELSHAKRFSSLAAILPAHSHPNPSASRSGYEELVASLASNLPQSQEHTDALINIFLDEINPTYNSIPKIFLADLVSSFLQRHSKKAYADGDASTVALIFSVFAIASQDLSPAFLALLSSGFGTSAPPSLSYTVLGKSTTAHSKTPLSDRCYDHSRLSLLLSDDHEHPSITSVYASLLLHKYCKRPGARRGLTSNKHLVTAISTAQVLGLHSEGSSPPGGSERSLLEREWRKRLWWSLYSTERQVFSHLKKRSDTDFLA